MKYLRCRFEKLSLLSNKQQLIKLIIYIQINEALLSKI